MRHNVWTVDCGLWTLLMVLTVAGCGRHVAYAVAVPVADVRSKPGSLLRGREHDPLEETQLLYGEHVRILETRDAWARIEALEQPEFTHHGRWEGYPGWVLQDAMRPLRRPRVPNAVITAKWATLWRDAEGTQPALDLPMGTQLVVKDPRGERWRVELVNRSKAWIRAEDVTRFDALERLSRTERRSAILHAAEQLLGDPYLWGGHSPRAAGEAPITGVDCSGLVHLAYRAAGLDIPRDAQEQYLRAQGVKSPRPADLIFLSEANHPEKIVHVMLYAGDGWMIEAPSTGGVVRRIPVVERLQLLELQLSPGRQFEGQWIYFGTYLP